MIRPHLRAGSRRAALVLTPSLAAAVLLAACSSGSPSSPTLASPVDGIIVGVDATNISIVRGFTLRTKAGQTIQFTLGELEDPTQFPPGHLLEHQATSQPVRVYFATSGSILLVYRLEDAPGSSAPAGPASGATHSGAGPSSGIGTPP